MDNIETNLKKVSAVSDVAQDSIYWHTPLNTLNNFRVP